MTESVCGGPGDLGGSVDERIAELNRIVAAGMSTDGQWLRRQLDDALSCWASDVSLIVIGVESRVDF